MSFKTTIELASQEGITDGNEKQKGNNKSTVDLGMAKVAMKPVPVKTLFFKYATKKECVSLFFGFLCISAYIHFMDSCYSIGDSDSYFLNILRRTVG